MTSRTTRGASDEASLEGERRPSARAFVTGGSGFIGGRLIRHLVADVVAVRALVRSERAAAAVEEAGAEPVRGELDDVAALRRGAQGCTVAFHAAAKVEAAG